MKRYIGSDVEKKKGRLYIDSRAAYLRPTDIVVIWYMITPTGRYSKFWHTSRWNGNHYTSINDNELKHAERKRDSFTKLLKGYTWSEPFLYCGKYIDANGNEMDGLMDLVKGC